MHKFVLQFTTYQNHSIGITFPRAIVFNGQRFSKLWSSILRNQNKRLDLFGLLRLAAEDYVFEIATVEKAVNNLREVLYDMEESGDIKLSEQIRFEIPELIKHGVQNMGNYHPQKPLLFNKNGDLVSEDFKLLYYYHNSLLNYDLEKKVDWAGYKMSILDLEKVN